MNKQEIATWLKKHVVYDYVIHDNMVVDVDGSVDLDGEHITELPFQFGTVTRDFLCTNTSIKSLKHCPHTVLRDFFCNGNKYVTSLEHCPHTVKRDFQCNKNRLLTSLKGCPSHIYGEFRCSANKLLSSLEGGPTRIDRDCFYNKNGLITLEHCPANVGGMFYCYDNPFDVTPKTYGSWIRAIKTNGRVYHYIKDTATPNMTAIYELRWEA